MSLTNKLILLLPTNVLRAFLRTFLNTLLSAGIIALPSSCSRPSDAHLPGSAPPQDLAADAGPTAGNAAPKQTGKQLAPVLAARESSKAPRVLIDGQLRLYPLTRNVWVYPQPNARRSWIGFLWFGSSVRLADATPVAGAQCSGDWYAVEPRGFVCVDEKKATLNPHHKSLAGITRFAPRLASPWPHQYGESIDLRRYRSLPSEKEQRSREWYYGAHAGKVRRARHGELVPSLSGVDLEIPEKKLLPLPAIPRGLRMGRNRLRRRSTVAWSEELDHNGRPFLLSADLLWVPKDRVITYPKIEFEGVHLGGNLQLPLAFFRQRDRPRFKRSDTGQFVERGDVFAKLSSVMLSERHVVQGKDTFIETTTPGLYVKQSDAVIPQLRNHTPWGSVLGETPDSKAPSRGRQTWMEASILGGWLIAYEGHKPVFTTLISPGRGGAPQKNRRPVETASTPTGRFKITGKFATATMVSSKELVHSSVPWAQNFSGPHALHSAYWHNDWGQLKSGGCINVSPIDGQWLFQHFTEPPIPNGWHGVRWLPKNEPATTLLVKRR